MKTRRTVATAVAVAAALSLAGCGKSYTPLTTKAAFTQAVSKAAKDQTSVRMTSKASALLTTEAIFSLQVPIAMQLVTSTTIDGKKNTATVRVVGNNIYIQASPTGKWGKLTAPTGDAASQVKDYGPAAYGQMFEKGVVSIRYVGATKIGGEQVQHYTLVMKSSELGSSFDALAAQVSSFAHLTTYEEQVYVTDQNLLRRITFTLPAPVGAFQTDFLDWNAPVSIKAPAPSAIVSPSGS